MATPVTTMAVTPTHMRPMTRAVHTSSHVVVDEVVVVLLSVHSNRTRRNW